jgi:signal transduction histidine kinase
MYSHLCCAFVVWISFFATSILCYLYERKLKKIFSKFVALQELVQIRGMFVNIASHELRNPMTTIYSSIDLLENYSDRLNEDEKLHLFENVRKSINRMTKMMDDIVLIGRLQHQQINYNPQPTNILHLCSSIVEGLEQNKSLRRIQTIIEHSVKPIVNIDASLLDHILTNLLSNALKYSDDLVLLRVRVRYKHILFDVIDHGIGIPSAEIQKLSQLFKRGSNTGSRQGIGIGMYLATRCVKLHQGTMKVFSHEHKETHFRVILPFANV